MRVHAFSPHRACWHLPVPSASNEGKHNLKQIQTITFTLAPRSFLDVNLHQSIDALHLNILKLGALALPTSTFSGISLVVKVYCLCCVPMTRPASKGPVPMKPLPSCLQPPTTSVQRLRSAVLCHFIPNSE